MLPRIAQLNAIASGNSDEPEQMLLAEIECLSSSLSEKFEEIRMIHDLTASLELQDDPHETCHELLEQLIVCVKCETMVIQLDGDDDDWFCGGMLGIGKPLGIEEIERLVHSVQAEVVNRRVVLLPISRGSTQLGRLIAIRNAQEEEFGTIEIDLMRSVLMVLALHLMNKRQFNEMQSMLEGTVRSLASALDAKDAYTHGHSSRVADLAVQLAVRLGLNDRSAETLQLAGILHDIGKIGIDDSVLKKPGKLTADEFDQIKRHPVLGYEILKDIRPFRHILPAVRHHHESWDGCGYPDGLVGEEIPRDAQILAVADAFDAMISDRPYRRGMPLAKVREIFEHGRGQQWAADVVDALLSSHDLMQSYADQRPLARPDLLPGPTALATNSLDRN